MSVGAAGSQRLEPFASRGSFDPVGTLIGVGQVTGDASGGTLSIFYVLDPNFAYIVRGVGLSSAIVASSTANIDITTGVLLDTFIERYGETFSLPSSLSLENFATYRPPPLLILPQQSPTIIGLVDNSLNKTLRVSFRALEFERLVLVNTPPEVIARFLVA